MDVLFGLINTALKLWTSKEKDKYADRFTSLQRQYWQEINKPDSERNNAVIDNLDFELRLLGSDIVAAVAKSRS